MKQQLPELWDNLIQELWAQDVQCYNMCTWHDTIMHCHRNKNKVPQSWKVCQALKETLYKY
jgi:hypothetical protein